MTTGGDVNGVFRAKHCVESCARAGEFGVSVIIAIAVGAFYFRRTALPHFRAASISSFGTGTTFDLRDFGVKVT